MSAADAAAGSLGPLEVVTPPELIRSVQEARAELQRVRLGFIQGLRELGEVDLELLRIQRRIERRGEGA